MFYFYVMQIGYLLYESRKRQMQILYNYLLMFHCKKKGSLQFSHFHIVCNCWTINQLFNFSFYSQTFQLVRHGTSTLKQQVFCFNIPSQHRFLLLLTLVPFNPYDITPWSLCIWNVRTAISKIESLSIFRMYISQNKRKTLMAVDAESVQ